MSDCKIQEILEELEKAPFLHSVHMGLPYTRINFPFQVSTYNFVLMDLHQQHSFWNKWFPNYFSPKLVRSPTDIILYFEVKKDLRSAYSSEIYSFRWDTLISKKYIEDTSFEEIFELVAPETQKEMLYYLNLFR